MSPLKVEHERRYETVAGRKQAHKTLHSIRLKGLRGQVAEPGAVRDLEILRHEGRTRGQGQDRR